MGQEAGSAWPGLSSKRGPVGEARAAGPPAGLPATCYVTLGHSRPRRTWQAALPVRQQQLWVCGHTAPGERDTETCPLVWARLRSPCALHREAPAPHFKREAPF